MYLRLLIEKFSCFSDTVFKTIDFIAFGFHRDQPPALRLTSKFLFYQPNKDSAPALPPAMVLLINFFEVEEFLFTGKAALIASLNVKFMA